jgi:hypothetical protein
MLAGTSRSGETVAGWMVTSRSYEHWLSRRCVDERVTSKLGASEGAFEMAQGDWWFDLKTHTVVPDNNDTKITDRLGPYKTREEAERALEKVEERNEEWDNDPRWNDDL